MIKQITEQLELPLERIYQLSLAMHRAGTKVAKSIPNVPTMVQLCLDFSCRKKRIGWRQRLVTLGIVTTVAITGLLAGLSIG